MANLEITNNDASMLVIGSTGIAKYQDDTFTAGSAKTFPAGTILARDSVSGKLIVFVKGGSTNGNGIPKALMGVELVTTGAGDVTVRPLISATVNRNLLVIDADGDNSNVDDAVKDQLRDMTLIVEDVEELSSLDNQ